VIRRFYNKKAQPSRWAFLLDRRSKKSR
jgi:hypothetical protein